jgi:16S rRNA (cytidine1402-2'-O)-methyltransferase
VELKLKQIGCLYIVATPIGNYRDITLRALDVLREVDAVICEDYRLGSTLLKKLDIPARELLLLNEHNEKEKAAEIAMQLVQGKHYALISDCGTPAFADPGTYLIQKTLEFQVPVIPVPGASSLMALLSLSPLPVNEFFFAGFPPRQTEARLARLNSLAKMNVPVVLMDTPYRLEKLLAEVKRAFGRNRTVTLAMDLTLESEKILHGSVDEISRQVGSRKSEFMLLIHS